VYRDIDPGLRRYRQQSKAGSVSHAGLQRFSTVPQALVSVIPDSLEFQEAATLPLSITLAAVGLYQKNHLDLPLPRAHSEETREDPEAEHTVLVINGASDIGSLAIQLATASGVRVIATASQAEARYVRSLGASVVVDELGASLAGALSMGTVQLSGIFDTRSTEETFAQIDALLQDIAQSPRVCAVNPPAHPPRFFVPTVGEFPYTCSERIPSLSLDHLLT
jgi:NADPH:quinone reductase-like Zn-dependent oxidoreductase